MQFCTQEVQSLYHIVECDHVADAACVGKSLQMIAGNLSRQTDEKINITIPLIHLNEKLSFANLSSLSIDGDFNQTTTIICVPSADDSNGSGFVFSNISGMLVLRNLRLQFCGVVHSIELQTHFQYISALIIFHCSNVFLSSVVVESSNGVGLTMEINQGDDVNITSSVFRKNQFQNRNNSFNDKNTDHFQGGGLHIVSNVNVIQQWNSRCNYTTVHIDDCLFENNTARYFTRGDYKQYVKHHSGSVHEEYSERGGGANVLLRGGTKDIGVTFSRCKFISNLAYIGSGLAVQITRNNGRDTENISVAVLDSVFEQNGCSTCKYNPYQNHTMGGGVYMAFDAYDFHDSNNVANSHFTIKNVSFTENSAHLGGGLYHTSGRSNGATNSMLLDHCTFEKNEGHLGSAVMLPPSESRGLKKSKTTTVITFQSCTFLDNHVYELKRKLQKIPGMGTVYVSSYDVYFSEYNQFTNNLGSGLYAVNGVLHLEKSSVHFENNTGLQGGAIALIGSSVMIMGHHNYHFVGNKASHEGGALYILLTDRYDFMNSRRCFIQCLKPKADSFTRDDHCSGADITFERNTASNTTTGHAIYATTLFPCQTLHSANATGHYHSLVDAAEVFTARGFKFINHQNQSQIATDAYELKRIFSDSQLTAIPGEKIKHGVTVTNEVGETINALFWANISNFDDSKSDIARLDPDYPILITRKTQLIGEPNQTATLRLDIASISESYIELDVDMKNCPPGFVFKNSKCVSNNRVQNGIVRCDSEKFVCYLLPGYWAGFIDGKLYTGPCPFCEYQVSNISGIMPNLEIALPRTEPELEWTVCGETRKGLLCGTCRANHTVHFHSPGYLCKRPRIKNECKLGWLLYLLSEILPVTIFFITVLVLNISFTSGIINGFILFVQLLRSIDLSAGGIIVIPDTIDRSTVSKLIKATNGYRVVYGVFNLDFFDSESLSFCLWENATALDMIAFKYVTILYSMMLMVTVVLIMNKCNGRCFTKCCRITAIKASVIHGISTFLMVGYAQCIKVSLSLLLRAHVYTANENELNRYPRVWFNGEIRYFSTEHLPYALPALFCLITVGLLPPVLLLMYPLVNRAITYFGLEDYKVFSVVFNISSMNRLKPLLDSFQGCFKDNLRFFAGIYFLYRWVLLLIHLITVGFVSYYIFVGGFFVFILTVHTVCQPYVSRLHNIIDALLMCNLVMINFISLYNFHYSNNPTLSNGTIRNTAIAQLVLIYLPAAVMIPCLLGTIICRWCKNRSTTTRWFNAENLRKLVQKRDTTSLNDLFDQDFIHDRLVDEVVDFDSS